MEMISNLLTGLTTWAIPLLLAITLHEACHGLVANWLGDPTAKSQGRLTLNPVKHIDPFGTIFLPLLLLIMQSGFLFGYAKPVPVNARNFKNPRRDMMWVALAGPGANILLALIGALLVPLIYVVPDTLGKFLASNLGNLIFINCLLAILNMLPLPPLDGGRVIVGLLPLRAAQKYSRIEPYGIFILVGVIFILPMLGNILGLNLRLGEFLITAPAQALYNLILGLFGIV